MKSGTASAVLAVKASKTTRASFFTVLGPASKRLVEKNTERNLWKNPARLYRDSESASIA
jgi:hypothetical protein